MNDDPSNTDEREKRMEMLVLVIWFYSFFDILANARALRLAAWSWDEAIALLARVGDNPTRFASNRG